MRLHQNANSYFHYYNFMKFKILSNNNEVDDNKPEECT